MLGDQRDLVEEPISFLIRTLIILNTLLCEVVSAGPLSKVPNAIPLFYTRRAANDLVYQGKTLMPEEAEKLHRNGIVDISRLDPVSDTKIWTNKPIEPVKGQRYGEHNHHLRDHQDDLGVQLSDETFEFVDNQSVIPRTAFFTVRHKDTQKSFVIMIGQKAHVMLLRKAILRKLGYYIPPIQHIKSFNLKFKSSRILNDFLNEDLKSLEFARNRWVTNVKNEVICEDATSSTTFTPDEYDKQLSDLKPPQIEPTEENQKCKRRWEVDNEQDSSEKTLKIQDALVFQAHDEIYNLAYGYVLSSMIRDRRVFNATQIPLALVDIHPHSENVSIFPWVMGEQVDNHLILTSEYNQSFTTSFEDAKWITRKILALSRKDFEEVVAQAHLPWEVGLLMVEKLISRRNSLRNHFDFRHKTTQNEKAVVEARDFKLFNETQELDVDYKISAGERLKNGILVHQEKWEGYGSSFTSETPESPISGEEFWAFLTSKALSNIIGNLVTRFNNEFLGNPNEQIQKALIEDILDQLYKQFRALITKQKVEKIPFGIWTTPIYSGNVLLNREIVIGSFLGTDNNIQIADTVGFTGSVGVHVGTRGLPTNFSLSGSAQEFLTRTYTRLKPIKSAKRALNEPFRNPLLPFLLQGEIPDLFDNLLYKDLSRLDGTKPENHGDLKQQLVRQFFKALTDNMEIGESLIITDNIGARVNANGGYSLAERVRLHAGFNASLKGLQRLHIHRHDKTHFQIYDDIGNIFEFIPSAGLQFSQVPIINLSARLAIGGAKTQFFTLDLEPEFEKNPDVIMNISILKDVMLTGNKNYLNAQYAPHTLSHDFDQWSLALDVLFFRNKYLSTTHNIDVETPKGTKDNYVHRSVGLRHGRDYQTLALDVLNSLISEYTEEDNVRLSSTNSGDPGDTLYGDSVSRIADFDGIIDKNNGLRDAFASITYRWKGWEASKAKINNIVDEINYRFLPEREGSSGFQLIPKEYFNDTKSIELYLFQTRTRVYEKAIHKLAQVSEQKYRELLNKYPPQINRHIRLDQTSEEEEIWRKIEILLDRFRRARNNFAASMHKKDGQAASKYGLRLVDILESSLPFHVFLELAGGENNVFVEPAINGFRVEDPNGDEKVSGNRLGRIGSEKSNGPIRYVQENFKMTESEFFIHWILEKL